MRLFYVFHDLFRSHCSQFGSVPEDSGAVRLGTAGARHRPVITSNITGGGLNVGPQRARAVPLAVKHFKDSEDKIFLFLFAVGTFGSDGHNSVCVRRRGPGRADIPMVALLEALPAAAADVRRRAPSRKGAGVAGEAVERKGTARAGLAARGDGLLQWDSLRESPPLLLRFARPGGARIAETAATSRMATVSLAGRNDSEASGSLTDGSRCGSEHIQTGYR